MRSWIAALRNRGLAARSAVALLAEACRFVEMLVFYAITLSVETFLSLPRAGARPRP